MYIFIVKQLCDFLYKLKITNTFIPSGQLWFLLKVVFSSIMKPIAHNCKISIRLFQMQMAKYTNKGNRKSNSTFVSPGTVSNLLPLKWHDTRVSVTYWLPRGLYYVVMESLTILLYSVRDSLIWVYSVILCLERNWENFVFIIILKANWKIWTTTWSRKPFFLYKKPQTKKNPKVEINLRNHRAWSLN